MFGARARPMPCNTRDTPADAANWVFGGTRAERPASYRNQTRRFLERHDVVRRELGFVV